MKIYDTALRNIKQKLTTQRAAMAIENDYSGRGGAVIVVIVFIVVSAIMAHNLIINAETRVKSSKEAQLKTRLIEYNMALLRFNLEEKKWPDKIDGLISKKGYLRNLSPDPFTKKTDYLLIEKNGQKYIISASGDISLSGRPYNMLCVNAAGGFYEAASPTLPSLGELMGYKK